MIGGGNRAQIIRMRYFDYDIRLLLAHMWWDWPLRVIERAMPALENGNLSALAAEAPNRE